MRFNRSVPEKLGAIVQFPKNDIPSFSSLKTRSYCSVREKGYSIGQFPKKREDLVQFPKKLVPDRSAVTAWHQVQSRTMAPD
jgi:hypothetical protein